MEPREDEEIEFFREIIFQILLHVNWSQTFANALVHAH